MSARDRYRRGLECLDCGRSGEAEFSENDGWSFMNNREHYVESVSEGFVVVDHGTDHGQETVIGCKCGGGRGVKTYSILRR